MGFEQVRALICLNAFPDLPAEFVSEVRVKIRNS
jgi:hypothetical protein